MKLCLTLHGLGAAPDGVDPREKPYWIGTDFFARILEWATKNRQRVHLTFNDGNISDVEIVLAALQKVGLGASFFFSTDFIGQPGYVDEDGIRTLAAAGMEIGSHGCRHISWLEMSGDAVCEDVICSFARLESILGQRISAVAPPFSECDGRVLRILRKSGVGRVYGGSAGPTADGDWLVRRVVVCADTTMDALESRLANANRIGWLAGTVRAMGAVGSAALWRRG